MPAPPALLAEAGVNLHNMENYFAYSAGQFTAISGILTFGYGAFIAAFVYGLLTLRSLPPRYRLAGILSCCVAATAGSILYKEASQWLSVFSFDELTGDYTRNPGQLFSDTYRYVNWAITVPMLLMTLTVVVPMGSLAKRRKTTITLVVAGFSMVFASWIGAFYETDHRVVGGSSLGFWFSYLVGWVFYAVLLLTVFKVLAEGRKRTTGAASDLIGKLGILFLVSWTIYALVLVQPLLWWSTGSVVVRQALFTVADVTSKAVYGVLMCRLAVMVADTTPGLPDAYRTAARTGEADGTGGGSAGCDIGVDAHEG